jgi:hypothetical protein
MKRHTLKIGGLFHDAHMCFIPNGVILVTLRLVSRMIALSSIVLPMIAIAVGSISAIQGMRAFYCLVKYGKISRIGLLDCLFGHWTIRHKRRFSEIDIFTVW